MANKDYDFPPVIEVSMAVYFKELPFLNNINLAARAFELREKFGMTRIDQTLYVDTRPEGEARPPLNQFNIHQGVQKVGVLMSSSDGTRRVSFQDNRFYYSWNKESDSEYPRYESIKKDFFELYDIFCNAVPALGIINADIVQAGIGYINLIPDDDAKGYQNLNLVSLDKFREHEELHLHTRQRLTHSEEVGRLYLTLDTLFHFEGNPESGLLEEKRKLKYGLVFRGKPSSQKISETEAFFNRGRKAIIDTFSQSLSDIGRQTFKEKDI